MRTTFWARRRAGPPNGGGGTPAFFFLAVEVFPLEKTLSIFVDESGDIGSLASHAPYYIVTLVLHDQANDISEAVADLAKSMVQDGFAGNEVIHTAPLIRREQAYRPLDLRTRRRIFSHLEHFMRRCPIRTKTFLVDKRTHGSGDSLVERLAREMGQYVIGNLGYFQSSDRVIVYCDQGQKEVSKTLRSIFSTALFGAEFRTVRPCDYRLFQVADLVCTLELVGQKLVDGTLSRSEMLFFGTARNLRKNHLRFLGRVRL